MAEDAASYAACQVDAATFCQNNTACVADFIYSVCDPESGSRQQHCTGLRNAFYELAGVTYTRELDLANGRYNDARTRCYQMYPTCEDPFDQCYGESQCCPRGGCDPSEGFGCGSCGTYDCDGWCDDPCAGGGGGGGGGGDICEYAGCDGDCYEVRMCCGPPLTDGSTCRRPRPCAT